MSQRTTRTIAPIARAMRSSSQARLAIERLEDRRLMTAAPFSGFAPALLPHDHNHSSHVNEGEVAFVVDPPLSADPLAKLASVAATSTLSPLSAIPVLNSKPGAPASLYIDFNGHFEASWSSYGSVTTPVFDNDGDAATFSSEELAFIETVWKVVAEDYAPFNINVTTVEPSVLAPGANASAANKKALRIAVGGDGAWAGSPGGIAQYDSFSNSLPNLAFVFADGSTNPLSTGSAVSHEAGHTFGLRHQIEYFSPGLTWGAVMGPFAGVGAINTWHNGITDLGTTQDDVAMIARSTNGFGFRPDDHAATITAATPLAGSGATFFGSGVISSSSDVDMFSLTTTSPKNLRISVAGDAIAQNLDAVIELRNAAGALLVSSNPGDSLDAAVIGDVNGKYYVAVKSNGEYGRLGQYTISVSESTPGVRVSTTGAPYTTSESGRSESITLVLDARPTADVTFDFTSSDVTEGVLSAQGVVFTAANWFVPQTVTVTGIRDGIVDRAASYAVTIAPAVSDDPAYSGFDPDDLTLTNLDDVAGKLFWLESFGVTDAGLVRSSSLTGENPQTAVDMKGAFGTPTLSFQPSRVAIDAVGGKAYWTDLSADVIRRANLDGSQPETIVTGVPNAAGLAVNSISGKIYWSDSTLRKIQRANLDGSSVEDVITSGIVSPGELEIDAASGKLYWADSGNFSITRANLDGSSVETIFQSDAANRPYGLELDVAAGYAYFSVRVNGQNYQLHRVDLMGGDSTLLLELPAGVNVGGLARDQVGRRLYWTDTSARRIYSVDDDGSDIALVTDVPLSPAGLAVLQANPDVTVKATSNLTTSEGGAAVTFTVVLNTPPTAAVTIPIASSDPTEGGTSIGSVTFTPFNWHLPQTVTVFGVDDSDYDQNVNYTVLLGAAVSLDASYQDLNPTDVDLVNVDNDPAPTKFYVVNDASQNLTYEYGASGSLVESYSLNSGNTAPRGAASSTAGDKTWVVDANRKVYVYNTSGGLLGSWTAGTIASNATVEGIATNGVDVWIVDANSDKVYRYSGAASRLTGSQNADSSFSLNSANSNAKDIVTDGQSLWIVNDASADKVFKYNLAGSLLGSWTISTSGPTSPTGITIDPANANDIWIVDSGTDRIYQYDSAATRTTGSQSASINFALAAGNSNPQGIADPPVRTATRRRPGVASATTVVTPSASLRESTLLRRKADRLREEAFAVFPLHRGWSPDIRQITDVRRFSEIDFSFLNEEAVESSASTDIDNNTDMAVGWRTYKHAP